MYDINERYFLQKYEYYKNSKDYKNNKIIIHNYTKFYALVAILCIITDNYGYSKEKYPYKYYEYFKNNLNL